VTAWYVGPNLHTKQSHRLIIPDDVLMQFDLLMMSAVTVETCFLLFVFLVLQPIFVVFSQPGSGL